MKTSGCRVGGVSSPSCRIRACFKEEVTAEVSPEEMKEEPGSRLKAQPMKARRRRRAQLVWDGDGEWVLNAAERSLCVLLKKGALLPEAAGAPDAGRAGETCPHFQLKVYRHIRKWLVLKGRVPWILKETYSRVKDGTFLAPRDRALGPPPAKARLPGGQHSSDFHQSPRLVLAALEPHALDPTGPARRARLLSLSTQPRNRKGRTFLLLLPEWCSSTRLRQCSPSAVGAL